tara:strand:+ start:1747 stop:2373 length:627 start_codon:yes stop_codon:yes gene_type:complete
MTDNYIGRLVVISAPSGGGKTSLIKELIAKNKRLVKSISYTTRQMRPGEVTGVNYNFVSDSEFKELLDRNLFLEHAKVYDHRYGTSKLWVENQLAKGVDVILDLDWQGARSIKHIFPKCVNVYLLPPSIKELKARLENRGQDSQEIIQKRIKMAKDDISHYNEFDYVIVNDSFDKAIHDMQAILDSLRLKNDIQKIKQAKLLQQLLAE